MTQGKRRDFEAEKRHWRHEVGRAIFAMGELEHLVVELIERLCRSPIPRTVLAMNLGTRLKLLCELIEEHGGDDKGPLSTFAKRVADLSGHRNIIAHNPLYFVAGPEWDDFRVCSLKGNDLDLHAVSKLADEATVAADDIQQTIMGLRARRT